MTCITDPTVGFVIDAEQLENASRDLLTVERIANNIGVETTTRLGDPALTLEGRLQEIVGNTYEQLNGGVWDSGITFNKYNEYMVYNGAEYKPKPTTTLPIVSGATPSTDFELFFSRTNIEDAKATIDAYNQENIGKYTAPVFGSAQDLADGITIGLNQVDFFLGMLLILSENDELRLFEVVDGSTLGATYTLNNGMKANEVFARVKEVEVYPESPLDQLGSGNDYRQTFTLSYDDLERPTQNVSYGWGGGVLSSNGFIFMAPYLSGSPVLRIETKPQVLAELAAPVGAQGYTSSVLAPNGFIYCFGETANVLKIDPVLFTITELSSILPANGVIGAVLSDVNGMIYMAPRSSGESVWVFDPSTEAAAVQVGSVISSSSDEWAFGCLAGNGLIYFAPYNGGTILEVDPSTDSTATIGSGFGLYRGGVVGSNGKIYMPPESSSVDILVLEPSISSTYTVPRSGSGGTFYGGVVLLNGSVAFIDPQGFSVMIIDPDDEVAFSRTIPNDAVESGTAVTGGVVSDTYGRIYNVERSGRNHLLNIMGVEGGIDYQFTAYANKL